LAIIAQAKANNVSTVFVKSSDGSSWWSQFSPTFVATLHAAGIHVCAWQYVYGTHPSVEAALGARAVTVGADCLAIDAESQYEGRYAQAQLYINDLRQAIGASFPVALASFPYVDYHPALPYSVFLGPNGAQYNVPQIYWQAIGTSVSTAVNHTYSVNTPYGRPIAPLGQAYNGTSPSSILSFRQLVQAQGSPGTSWWDWQEATTQEWQAIGQPLTQAAAVGHARETRLSLGARGDLVVWAQEHLRGAGEAVPIRGTFDRRTAQAVMTFQRSVALPATGVVDGATWKALLGRPTVAWSAGRARTAAAAGPGRSGPPSALLRARRYEIPPKAHTAPG
jgi:hypothetical protein